ncbi:hypothetical protein GF337_08660 [candidate division KSB1 bacterium]|nr:hypothetical protein [candidate division KSB1 bacterium]
MFRLRMQLQKFFAKDKEKNIDNIVEYNPQNIENVLQKFDRLTEYIDNLEKSLKAAETKSLAYEDILHKYERIFKEEITVYRLHKSNISVLNKTFNENELFLHEIENQIRSFVSSDTEKPKNHNERISSVRRILSRFFHQNELHKSRVQQKINELNETIEQKNRLVERMHGEIENWHTKRDSSFMPPQQTSVKQACG